MMGGKASVYNVRLLYNMSFAFFVVIVKILFIYLLYIVALLFIFTLQCHSLSGYCLFACAEHGKKAYKQNIIQ